MNALKFALQMVERVSGPSRKATRGLRNVEKAMVRVDRAGKKGGSSINRMGERMRNLGKSSIAMSGQLSLAGTAMNDLSRKGALLLEAPNREAVTFEKEMSRVKALSQSTGEAFAAQERVARQLGATTIFTAQEAAQGMGFLAMAGFDAEKQIAALPAVLDLATAAGSDLGRTAEISSNIMGAFGLRAEEMRSASDVLAATFTNSNTTLESLGETMKYVGPNAKAAGVGLAEVAKFAALMGNAGIDGSLAGTALRATLQRLSAPPKAAAKALKALRVETKNAAGDLRSPVEIFRELNEAMSGMGSGDRMGAISAIFGVRASAGVAEVLDKLSVGADSGVVGFEQLSKAIDSADGRTEAISKTMTDNRWGRLKELQSAFSELLIVVGDAFAPALLELVKAAKSWTATVTAWVKAHPELTANTLKVVAAFTAFAAVGATVASAASAISFAFGGIAMTYGGLSKVLGLLSLSSGSTGVAAGMAGMGAAAGKASMLSRALTGIKAAGAAAALGVGKISGAATAALASVGGLKAVMLGLGKAIAVVGAAWAGWELGKILDAKVPKWLGMEGNDSLSTRAGKGVFELINGETDRMDKRHSVRGLGDGGERGSSAAIDSSRKTLNYQPVVHVNVDGAKDGKDVGDSVERVLRRDVDRMQLQGAY